MISIHSIFVGRPEWITDEAGVWESSIFRQAVFGPVELGSQGIVGDSSEGRASDCASGRWLDAGLIELYRKRQPTISEHRQTIAKHMRRVKLPDLLIEVDNQ